VPFEPTGGHQIAKTLPDGSKKVYVLTKGPKGRYYEPLNVPETRIIVFGKLVSVQPAP
jgi:hypothetical protein